MVTVAANGSQVMVTAKNAVEEFENQLGRFRKPKASKPLFTIPKEGFKSITNSIPIAALEIILGNM